MKKLLLTLAVTLVGYTGFAQACSLTLVANLTPPGSDPYNITFDMTTSAPPTGPSVMTHYQLAYGDGMVDFWYNALATSISHTYFYGGTYSPTLIMTVYDSVGGTIQLVCSDTAVATVVIGTPGSVNCNNHQPAIDYYVNNGLTVAFHNITMAPSPLVNISFWDFGDGNSSTSSYTQHVYSAPGTYTVKLINSWADSSNLNILCTDSTTVQVFVASDYLQGYVFYDTTVYLTAPAVKVWLISHDSMANTLTAVDSTMATGFNNFYFQNPAPGAYLIKAAPIGGNLVTPGTGYVPTYHDSSLYWNLAGVIYYAGGVAPQVPIWLKQGTPVAGPGFIGGNISQGANKSTSGGVAGILVYLRDNNNHMVRATYTDANGDYSFGNIATGMYNIYPEEMNYMTTASSLVMIVNSQSSFNNINFTQTSTEIRPVVTSVGQVPLAGQFRISPNPAGNYVQISRTADAGAATFSLLDMTGRTIIPGVEAAAGSATLHMDISGVPAGLYFLRIESGKEQHTEKIIVQH